MDIAALVAKATSFSKSSSDVFSVDEVLLSRIKSQCRQDEQSLLSVFHYLSMDLQRRNGASRIKALSIMDVLFQRSKLFRETVANNIRAVAHCAGLLDSLDGDARNSLASSYRSEVEHKVKVLIETWDEAYGKYYPQIHAVARYFKETLRLQMPNVQATARRIATESTARQQEADNLVLLRTSKLIRNELGDTVGQVDRILCRMAQCFSLLFPNLIEEEVHEGALTSPEGGNLSSGSSSASPPATTHDIDGDGAAGSVAVVSRGPPSNPSTAQTVVDVLTVNGGEKGGEDNNGNSDGGDDDDFGFDDVDWVDEILDPPQTPLVTETAAAAVDSGASTSRSHVEEMLGGGVPYTLDISLSTSAADIQTADNRVLVDTVRELASQLVRHIVPRLVAWRALLAEASGVTARHEAADRRGRQHAPPEPGSQATTSANGGNTASVLGKRSFSSSVSAKAAVTSTGDANHTSSSTAAPAGSSPAATGPSSTRVTGAEVARAAAEVDRLLGDAREMLVGKCRDLFRT